MLKVAILGTVPHTRAMAPFDDPSWEIWPCSPANAYGVVPRATRWFELHGVEDLKGPDNKEWCARYFAWLREQKFPVYMQEANDLLPECAIFPARKLLDQFAPYSRVIFTSSISWMAAYALSLGAKEIAIFGVDMAAVEEQYSGQKSGLQTLAVFAEERFGVSIQTPMDSSLMVAPPLYGYAEASHMGRFLYIHEVMMNQKFEAATNAMNQAQLERQFIAGQLESLKFFRRTFVDGEHDSILHKVEPKVTVPGVARGAFQMGDGGVLVPVHGHMNGSGDFEVGRDTGD